MSDPNRLEAIAQDLRRVAGKYTSAVDTLQRQSQGLDGSAQDLTYGTQKWAGKGSQAFLNSWNQYHHDTQRSCDTLTQSATALNKLAKTIEDNVQAIRNAQAQATAGFILTGALVIADIAQLGLDPITDGATVASGGADAALVEEAQAAEEAIVEMDTEVSGELDQITSQIENSTEPGDVNIPTGDSTDGLSVSTQGDSTTELFQKNLDGSGSGNGYTSTGEQYIKDLQDMGVQVKSDPETQEYLRYQSARASTQNWGEPGDYGPHQVDVNVGENATDASIYEEYLHVQAAAARGWTPITPPESLIEEVNVEREVLANANRLGMTAAERNELQQILQGYIRQLAEKFGIHM